MKRCEGDCCPECDEPMVLVDDREELQSMDELSHTYIYCEDCDLTFPVDWVRQSETDLDREEDE